MRYLLLFSVFSLFLSCNVIEKEKQIDTPSEAAAITTYYLIRHAEKDRTDPENSNPNLTEAGVQRARNWASFFQHIDLDKIYATNFNRTQQTASFVATKKNIEVQSYNPSNLYDEAFQKQTIGKTVLVVGHSNTTPQFVNAILGETKYTDMNDNDNGSVYVVSVAGDSKKVQILTYN
ncbi:histidine phosphatase superfamily protein (branch 1) [Ulvibacter sp. MAR_2010_11]|uniref:SixA phosphatase family protein n=1 Tax=Ulvibacter sp. MAR_2010_11 TaxID=1250229 RepID=UPI000C2C4E2D|nr:histidine phosphatase family protein [Ulvibacter sp. MAR_2010_11]PKA84605.1 histidine phosphatase superfamily protein (branch 1) [Ulvibacter sp. MAR_2010_11]